MEFGAQLAKDSHNRTCGTRNAGLRGAKLRPAAVPFGTANSAFKIQDSKLRGLSGHICAYISVRVATCGVLACDDKEQRASAAGRLRPTRPLPRSIPVASDKPAAERMGLHERPADARMQPSARGRLRAAGRCATELDTTPSATNSSCGPLGPDGPIPHTAQRLPKQHTRHPAVCSPPPAIATNLVAGIPCLD